MFTTALVDRERTGRKDRYPGMGILSAGIALCLIAGPFSVSAVRSAEDTGQEEVRTYSYRTDKTQSTGMPGQAPSEVRSRLHMTWTVEPLDASSCRIRVSEASLNRDPGGSSSQIAEANQIAAVVRLDSRGGIASAEGLESNAYVQEAGGVDYFLSELDRLFLYRPEGELVPGSEWTRERIFPAERSGFQLQYTLRDTFRCIERTVFEGIDAFRIEVSSERGFEGEGELAGYPAFMVMPGTASATILVDAGTGIVLSHRYQDEGSGGIDVEGMMVDLAGTGTTVLEIVRD